MCMRYRRDKSNSFNISTTVSFIVASAGIPVIKHGNRSITSHSGSTDLLNELGIKTTKVSEVHYKLKNRDWHLLAQWSLIQ